MLYDPESEVLFLPQFWLLPIYRELLNTASRNRPSRDSELRRSASGLVKVLCKPSDSVAGGKGKRKGKLLKQGSAVARVDGWFGSMSPMNTLYVWFPASVLIGLRWMMLRFPGTSPSCSRASYRTSFHSERPLLGKVPLQPQRVTVSLLLRDFLQPRRQFCTMTTRHASLAPICAATLQRERRQMQSKHLWDTIDIQWPALYKKLYTVQEVVCL